MKNTHLEHLEDNILNGGSQGGKEAVAFLRSLGDMLDQGMADTRVTVKWDGAPAIICGVNPENGRFFVGTKSVFNKVSPKISYSEEDVDSMYSAGQLAEKLKDAYKYLSTLSIPNVVQGDLLFTDDKYNASIGGDNCIAFQPNTIVYAVPVDSDFGKTIKNSKIGVVWHTTYEGDELQSMKAKFGADISKMNKTSTVWMDDATYKDVAGKATMTEAETEAVTKSLSNAGKMFRGVNSQLLTKFLTIQNGFTGDFAGASLKTYNNSKVRKGERISNPKSHAAGYIKWVEGVFDKKIDKLKTPVKKKEVEVKKIETVRELKKHTKNLALIIAFQNSIVEAKMGIVKKLNSVKQLTDTFIRTSNGFKVTNPEGFVAIDRVSGQAVKLVDRMEFSFNNFTAIKAWDR